MNRPDERAYRKFGRVVVAMNIIVKTVTGRLPEYRRIRALMHDAFPANERIPMWRLRFLALRRNVDFRAFYDDDRFCGLSYTISTEKMIFLLYLATDAEARSQGYGTYLLSWLQKNSEGKEIVVNVEPPDACADNYVQRRKRISFYDRNHFYDTGCSLLVRNDTYRVLSSSPVFNAAEFRLLMRTYRFGVMA